MPKPTYHPFIDGHEMAAMSTFVGTALVADRTLPKGWSKHLIHRHPMIAMSFLWAGIGLGATLVFPRMRAAMGLSTDNYDPSTPWAYKQDYRKPPEL